MKPIHNLNRSLAKKDNKHMNNGAGGLLYGLNTEDEDDKFRELQILRYKNGSLNSPSLKQLITNNIDGRSVLKSEIVESN